MRIRHFFIIILGLLVTPLSATVITLQNGQTIRGEILVQNEEIVIIKNADGQRFQYPPQEIVTIAEEQSVEPASEESSLPNKITGKKTAIYLSIQGGGAFIPNSRNGGYVGGELMIGSRYIGSRHIFIGGGIGVNALILPQQTYTYLPLQVAVKVPIIEGKHAPYVGANIGYGFALSANCSGGIYSAFEVGYRYQAGQATTLYVGIGAQFQQTKIDENIIITSDKGVESTYQDYTGRNLVTFGAKIGISF